MAELNYTFHPVHQLLYHRQQASNNVTNQSAAVLHRFRQFAWYDDAGVPAGCSVPEVTPVQGNRFTVPINGGILPSLVFITVITNTLVCAVLLRKNMRTSTNTLLVAMAVSDTLTGIWSVPFFVHLYTLRGYDTPLGYWWCRFYYWMTDYLPTVFHTASIWLTVALATERYLQVCHMLVAKNVCTIRNMMRAIAVIYAAAISVHLVRFFDNQVFPLPVSKSIHRVLRAKAPPMLVVTKTITCCFDYVRPFSDNIELYFSIYFWFRIVLVHAVPCVSLTLLNTRLAGAIRQARLRRSRLIRQHRMQEYRRLGEANATTLMLLVVVSVFLVVELPTAIHLLTLILENNSRQVHVDPWTRSLLEHVTNLLIVFSYPLNFFIYCVMSRQFRQTFRNMFTGQFRREHPSSARVGQSLDTSAVGVGSPYSTNANVNYGVRLENSPPASEIIDDKLVEVRRFCTGIPIVAGSAAIPLKLIHERSFSCPAFTDHTVSDWRDGSAERRHLLETSL